MAKSPKYVTKCIYFPDKEKIEQLEKLLTKYPKTTLSTVFAQLVDAVTKEISALPDGKRQAHINTQLWV
jgi:hypothetical protein